MGTQYAVLHTEKGKGSGGGLGNHIDRKEGMEHTYPHSDPTKKNLNREFVQAKYKQLSLPDAVKLRINEGYTQKRAIRKDAVKYLSTVLTGSHERMTEISKDKTLFNNWIKQNYQFACDEFGKENIVRFTLHMDEKTPHIHVVHVPITEKGGLSAREYIGNKTKLKGLQDRYAQKMKPFGLARGQEGTGIRHERAQEYYKRIETTDEQIEDLIVTGRFGIKKDQTIDNLRTALRTAHLALADKRAKEKNKLKALASRLKQETLQRNKLALKNKQLKGTIKSFVKDPKKLDEFIQKIHEKGQKFEKNQSDFKRRKL